VSKPLRAEDLPFSLDVELVAQVLNLSPRQVYELLPKGKIPGAAKFGAQWRINRDILLASFAGNSASR
jgi:excisionase family DNA binding protein